MYEVFFSSRRRHTRFKCDWSADVCSSDLTHSRTQTHKHTNTHTHTLTHARVRTHTRTHTHTHTHAHAVMSRQRAPPCKVHRLLHQHQNTCQSRPTGHSTTPSRPTGVG